ncbi:terminase large subunit domain-containing protein [Anaerosporobacter sp.]
MAISKETKEKLKFLWQDENTVDWIQTFIKIADKSGKIVPFILTPEQREFVQNMHKENIILKSRQLGLSSVTVALSIRACVVQDNTTCFLVSHNQSSTNTIFDKLKQQFNSLPEFIKPELLTNNRQELKFTNGSKITCLTAGNKEIGRGDTLNGIIHLSEFAYWKNAEKQLNALSQAVSDTGKIIIESTANGFNKYSEVYYQAKNNENSYKSFFFNWINGKELFKSQYESAMVEYKARNGKELLDDDLDEDELTLKSNRATLNQLAWRRKKISTDGKDAFNVEYPTTDADCFLTSGAQLFDTKKIDRFVTGIVQDKIIPISKGKIIGLPSILQTYYGKSLKIWGIPKVGERYYIAVD